MDLHTGRALSTNEISALLSEARQRTLGLVAPLDDEALARQHDPLMSPIVWDLGHIGHFEEVWLLEKLADPSVGTEGLRGMYNPFENPRATRDELPLPSLSDCRAYLTAVRQGVLDNLADVDLAGSAPLLDEGFVFRLVLQHEYQHCETILQTLQLKAGEPYTPPLRSDAPTPDPDAPAAGEMVRVAGGRFPIGTDDRSAAYDNERPRHLVEIESFWMDVHPVTNREYAAFIDDGGYRRPELWAKEGWAWRTEAELEAPKYWTSMASGWTERFMDRTTPLEPERPVCHVDYWEADAYARWAGKRLPREFEWEVAAGWDGEHDRMRAYPWGDEAPGPAHANLDARIFETTPIGSYPRGVAPSGCWDMLGNVWEWTSSDFGAYPGYETFPYPEYSEVFFGKDYKVLRGGSWATRFGAIRNTFRNWDYPIRRQIFSGIRCARDD